MIIKFKQLAIIGLLIFSFSGCEDLINLALKTDMGKEYVIKSYVEDIYRPAYESQGIEWEKLSNDFAWKGKKGDTLSYISRLEYQVVIQGRKVKTCVLTGVLYSPETDERTAAMQRVLFTNKEDDCRKNSYSPDDYAALAKKYKLVDS